MWWNHIHPVHHHTVIYCHNFMADKGNNVNPVYFADLCSWNLGQSNNDSMKLEHDMDKVDKEEKQ